MTDNYDNVWAAIAAPLDPRQIKTRKHDGVKYISRADVINRLNNVCPDDWHFQVQMISKPDTGGWVAKGTLTILGVTREDFGMPNNADHFDPPKAAASDALKRCASQFGFAIELYGDDYENAAEPTTAPQNVNQHWTVTQDWAQFWTWAKNSLGLSEDDVHVALDVESVKEFTGSKNEAVAILQDAVALKEQQ